jgi:tetraacyldisaccharide 4'-kinase
MTGHCPIRAAARDRRSAWLAVVSGEKRGPAAGLMRGGLLALAGLYRAGLAAGNLRFALPGGVRRAAVPVVSVGNLTVGGTGKTPMVAYLARLAVSLGRRPVILSRGYGAQAGGPNEEALELERLCPGVPHVQNSDRRRALEAWAAANPCDLAILDDGFQHRRLARDLNIVLVDATAPFGYGHVLPRGLLREPPSALRRADMAVITRAELVETPALADLRQQLAGLLAPGTPVLVAKNCPTRLALANGTSHDLAWLRGREVAAACGIGNPAAFAATLRAAGATVRLFRAFPDHYAYTAEDLAQLLKAAEAVGAKRLVTTGKDFVKWRPLLGHSDALGVQVAALEATLEFLEGEEVLRRKLGSLGASFRSE